MSSVSVEAPLPFEPLDLERSFSLHRLGRGDTTARLSETAFSKVFWCGGELVEVALHKGDDGRVYVSGPEELVASWLASFPATDGYEDFRPRHPGLRQALRRLPGLRMFAVPWMFDVLVSCILQQRIRFIDAKAEWTKILKAHGTAASDDHLCFPSPRALARLRPEALMRFGVDRQRAQTLVRAAHEQARDPFLHPSTPWEELEARLLAIPGIGPWTVGMLGIYAGGQVDAVPLGDLHLPHSAQWFFRREPRGSDEEMLALLEPFRGQRGRVVRLLLSSVRPGPRGG